MCWLLLLSLLTVAEAVEDIAFIPLTKAFLDKLRNETFYNKYATPTQYDGECRRTHKRAVQWETHGRGLGLCGAR